jgi:KDO2-lipid IV(A) lauroyltransferase
VTLKKLRRRLTQPFHSFGIHLLRFLILPLPLGGVRRLGSFIGWIIFRVPSCRRIVLGNLEAVFPGESPEWRLRVGRASCGSLATTVLEFLWLHCDQARIDRHFFVSPELEAYFAVREEKRPSMLFTLHSGNWELAAIIAGRYLPPPVTLIARRFKSAGIERLVSAGRSFAGAQITHEKGAVRDFLKTLKAGGAIGMLVDQNTKIEQGGVFVDFLGLPATMSRTPSVFARRMNCRIGLFPIRRTPEGFRAEYLALPEPASLIDDHSLSQSISDVMSDFIRRNPEEWVWLYKRWHLIPKDAPPELAARYPAYSRREGTDNED